MEYVSAMTRMLRSSMEYVTILLVVLLLILVLKDKSSVSHVILVLISSYLLLIQLNASVNSTINLMAQFAKNYVEMGFCTLLILHNVMMEIILTEMDAPHSAKLRIPTGAATLTLILQQLVST